MMTLIDTVGDDAIVLWRRPQGLLIANAVCR